MKSFIHGPDRLLAREAVLALCASVDPDSSNTTWFDARESAIDQIVSAIGSASFYGGQRVVVVSHLLSRGTRSAPRSSTGPTATDKASRSHPELEMLLASTPEQNCLILFEPDLDAPPPAVKSASPPVTIVANDPPRGSALVAWIGEAAQRSQSRIENGAARLLAETLFPRTWERKPANPRYDRPPDLARIAQEIEKLALAAHPEPIAREHILAVVATESNQQIFRFIDAAIIGDLATAVRELDRLAKAGEEPAVILSQTLGHLELMTVASAALGRNAASVAKELGSVTPARMSAVMSSGQRGKLTAQTAVTSGATIDRALKTGRTRHPETAVHDVMLALVTDPRGGA